MKHASWLTYHHNVSTDHKACILSKGTNKIHQCRSLIWGSSHDKALWSNKRTVSKLTEAFSRVLTYVQGFLFVCLFLRKGNTLTRTCCSCTEFRQNCTRWCFSSSPKILDMVLHSSKRHRVWQSHVVWTCLYWRAPVYFCLCNKKNNMQIEKKSWIQFLVYFTCQPKTRF